MDGPLIRTGQGDYACDHNPTPPQQSWWDVLIDIRREAAVSWWAWYYRLIYNGPMMLDGRIIHYELTDSETHGSFSVKPGPWMRQRIIRGLTELRRRFANSGKGVHIDIQA